MESPLSPFTRHQARPGQQFSLSTRPVVCLQPQPWAQPQPVALRSCLAPEILEFCFSTDPVVGGSVAPQPADTLRGWWRVGTGWPSYYVAQVTQGLKPLTINISLSTNRQQVGVMRWGWGHKIWSNLCLDLYTLYHCNVQVSSESGWRVVEGVEG